jgi:NADPH:quinone reductase-like Zn-dependent oxidoreductase
MTHHFQVQMPTGLTFEKAAASVVPLLRAYDALYYHANIKQGDFIFVPRGAHAMSFALVQLALRSHCHVVTTVATDEEKEVLQDLLDTKKNNLIMDEIASSQPRLRIFDTRTLETSLKESVLEETGRVGVDCVMLRGDEPENFIDECLGMMSAHSVLLSPSQNIDVC